jgi:hypothetical protein
MNTHATSYRRELIPLPLRIAESQKTRLSSIRDRTGISVQEHIRRAIDLYLAVTEKEAIELGLMPQPVPVTPLRPIMRTTKR